MKLKPIASNMTELHLDNGTIVLFSYETPVAAYMDREGFIRTDHKWSVTTSRHINKWLAGRQAESKPQNFLDGLLCF